MQPYHEEWVASLRALPPPLSKPFQPSIPQTPRDPTASGALTSVTLLERPQRGNMLFRGPGPEASGVKGELLWWKQYSSALNASQAGALATYRQSNPESPRKFKAFYAPKRFPIVRAQPLTSDVRTALIQL